MGVSMRESPSSRSGFVRRNAWLMLSMGAAFALAACGGGGGGSNPPPAQQQNPPPANTAPTAQAGADQTITLPTNSVQLQGSGQDSDAGAALTYAWTVTSGTGVTFSSASSATPTATFPTEGTYVLTLTVSDGSLSGTDAVQVVVNAAPAPTNVAPTANAGTDQTITLPATSVQLQGTATDDNLPNNTLTYAWSSTNAQVQFATANALATAVTLPSTAGTYDLTLTVSDGALSATDVAVITVADAAALVYPAPDTNETDEFRGWAKIDPAAAGMDVAKLDTARDYAESGAGAGGSGFISRGGRLVYSWGQIDQRYEVKSTTKSIGGIALALAIKDNLLTLQTPAFDKLPSVGTDPLAANDEWRKSLTVLQLATHTAGFEKPSTVDGRLTYQPGTTWLYSDASVTWLADVLTQVYGRDLKDVLFERVYSRIGIAGPVSTDDFVWSAANYRGPTLGPVTRRELHSGIGINTNSMARVGLLFLRRGVWANNERLLDESFIDLVRTPRPEVAATTIPAAAVAEFPNANQHYGVLWWTNADGALAGVPTDAYWAWGLGDSLLVVIPSLDLVIARAGLQTPTDLPGRAWNDGNWDGRYEVLLPFLLPIVESVTP